MERTKKIADTHYIIHYKDPKEDEIMSLKAQTVTDSSLGLSFICVADFLFDNHGSIIKPSEEQLQKRLENVKSLHLSLYSIISIEEVGNNHLGLKFDNDKSKLLVLPQEPPLNH